MRKYVVNEQQLDEIKWLKNLAGKFMEPGRGQNVAGRERLAQTQEKLYGEIQNYLGMRDMSLRDLSPQILAKFLTSNGIEVDPADIPADPNGIVSKDTVKNLVRDLSIKSLTGEPLTYDKPTAPTSVLKRSQPSQSTAAGGSGDFLKNWLSKVSKAVDDDAKAELGKELLAFMSQKASSPDGAREIADMFAGQSSAPAQAAPNTPQSPEAKPTSAPAAKAKAPTAKKASSEKPSAIPTMPSGPAASATSKPNITPTMPSGGKQTAPSQKSAAPSSKSSPAKATEPAKKFPKELDWNEWNKLSDVDKAAYVNDYLPPPPPVRSASSAKSEPAKAPSKSSAKSEPAKATAKEPAKAPSKSSAKSEPAKATAKEPAKAPSKSEPSKAPAATAKKPETTTVKKGGQKITLPAMPGEKKAESIAKIVAAINEGKKFPNGLKVYAEDYKYFLKIMEMMNLTLKDLGLWRVLKESNSQYVTLQVR